MKNLKRPNYFLIMRAQIAHTLAVKWREAGPRMLEEPLACKPMNFPLSWVASLKIRLNRSMASSSMALVHGNLSQNQSQEPEATISKFMNSSNQQILRTRQTPAQILHNVMNQSRSSI